MDEQWRYEEAFAHALGFEDWHGYLNACSSAKGKKLVCARIAALAAGEPL